MPTLKQLTCSIEWADTKAVFQEYGTVYGDGIVETFIAVPEKPQPFTVRLVSKGFVSEGLAMIVFIDGEYQCNRNRSNLRPFIPGAPKSLTEVDFTLRQKEKPISDGMYLGREWRFDTHNVVSDLPPDVDKSHFDSLGNIEILVLRCKAMSTSEGNRSRSSSGADSVPLADCAASISNAEEEPPAYNDTYEEAAAKATGEPGDGAVGVDDLTGLFDGADDVRPSFGLDGAQDSGGYWTWSYILQHNEGSPPYEQSRNYVTNCPDEPRSEPYPPHLTRPMDTMPSGEPAPYTGPQHQRKPQERHVHWDSGPPRPSGPLPRPQRNASRTNAFPSPRHGQSWEPGRSWQPHQSSNSWSHGGPARQQQEHRSTDPNLFQHRYGHPTSNDTEYNDYQNHPVPPNIPAIPHAYLQPSYPNFHPWIPPQTIPTWPSLQPPSLTPPPHAPVLIPPYHPNHPYYACAGSFPPYQSATSSNEGWPSVNQRNAPADHPGGFDPASGDDRDDNDQIDPPGWTSDDTANNGNSNWDKNADSKNNEANAWGDTGGNSDSNVGQNNDVDKSWDHNDSNGNNKNTQNQDSNNDDGWATAVSNNESNQQEADGWNDTNNNAQSQPMADWSTPTGKSTQSQPGDAFAATMSSADQPRPLYGPHGPYLTLQSFTLEDGPAEAEEEARYDVPQSLVDETGTSRQVQPGPGYLYVHRGYAPEYVDSVQEPYARFIFKYRTKDQLKQELGIELDTEPSGSEEVQALQALDKQQIIDMLLRAQSALGGKIPSPPPDLATSFDESAPFMQPVAVPRPKEKVPKYTLPPLRSVSNLTSLGISGATQNQTSRPMPTLTKSGWNNAADTSWTAPAQHTQQESKGWNTPDEAEHASAGCNVPADDSGTVPIQTWTGEQPASGNASNVPSGKW